MVVQPDPVRGGPRDDDFGTDPQPSTQPSEPPTLGRFTVLLLGVESRPNRAEALTDTMIVASLDPISGAVSMVSVPRDLVDAPCRTAAPSIRS
jgi:hypothetical protein